ncbi:MAG: serine/threonine-protein kinase [Kofleriaceae bacterium]
MTAQDLAPGNRLGEYQILSLIAKGGFGAVYKAEHVLLGRVVAIKVLHEEFGVSSEAALRFEREARAANLIRHHNVVDIFDFGRLPSGQPYFVMELLAGRDLHTKIEEEGRLALHDVVALVEPLCSAVAAAHAANIIHRDIKASNVFLHDRGDATRVVLLDFGVAKMLDPMETSLTTSRQAIGTPACMSPEQIVGDPVDGRTDVYGLAALCFHALTGAPPFADPAITMAHHMHLHARRPRASEYASVPPGIDDVIIRGMSRSPDDRFPDVLAFLDALRTATMPRRTTRNLPRSTFALGVHLEIVVAAGALDEPDEHLLDDMEAILPAATRELATHGFRVAFDASTSALFVLALPPDDAIARRDAVRVLCDLERSMAARSTRDARAALCFTLRTGQVLVSDDGSVRGGDLLGIASWVRPERVAGLVAYLPVIEGLALRTESAGDGVVRIVGDSI